MFLSFAIAVVVVVARHRHSTIAVLELDAFAHGQDTVLRHTFQTPSKSRLLSSQVEKLGASTLPALSARADHADSLCLEAPYTHPLSLSSLSTSSSTLSSSSTGSGVHLNFVWNFSSWRAHRVGGRKCEDTVPSLLRVGDTGWGGEMTIISVRSWSACVKDAASDQRAPSALVRGRDLRCVR